MKNFSRKAVLLFVILAFLFSVSVEKAEATCPSGYTSQNVSMTVFGCPVTLVICLHCSPSGSVAPMVIIEKFIVEDVGCSTSTSPSHTMNEIYEQALIQMRILVASLCSTIPCSQGHTVVTLKRPVCVYNEYKNINGVLTFNYVGCNATSYCVITYDLCYEIVNGIVVPVVSNISKFQTGTPECSSTVIPFDPDQTSDYSTSCYALPCDN
ncbi:MAG: hypothetical protein NTW25_08950 [Candidatus Kapabacteria bacterium]|nr:hypothetical protein [Candidatus Kapabacteria bacterium]